MQPRETLQLYKYSYLTTSDNYYLTPKETLYTLTLLFIFCILISINPIKIYIFLLVCPIYYILTTTTNILCFEFLVVVVVLALLYSSPRKKKKKNHTASSSSLLLLFTTTTKTLMPPNKIPRSRFVARLCGNLLGIYLLAGG